MVRFVAQTHKACDSLDKTIENRALEGGKAIAEKAHKGADNTWKMLKAVGKDIGEAFKKGMEQERTKQKKRNKKDE